MDDAPKTSGTKRPTALLPRPRSALVAVPLLCWAAFCWGALGHYLAIREVPSFTVIIVLILAPVAALMLWIRVRAAWAMGTRGLAKALAGARAAVDQAETRHVPVLITLASCLGLYAELAVIRLHASDLQLFAYYKNVTLLSCFLGLGLGYALGRRGPYLAPLFLPVLTVQLIAISWLAKWDDAPFLQNPITEHFSLGMYDAQTLNAYAAVFGFIGFVFAVNALCFVPLGQLAARLMARLGKLQAYGWNLLGGIAGILLFNLVSFLWAPPVVWILLVTLMTLPFLLTSRPALAAAAVSSTVLLAFLGWQMHIDVHEIYSPYQKVAIGLQRQASPEIRVANVYYQRMLDLSEVDPSDEAQKNASDYYSLPYQFKGAPRKVLIVGSGTGNDVAAALRHGAGEVHAVEIDPVILDLGKLFHPEAPYDSPKVRAVNNDARLFIRSTREKYDLIVYGLLDSHTLLSSASSVRLDSFVYTVEGFREARSKLAEGGMISMAFSVAHPLLAKKIFEMLRLAFGGKMPLVFNSQYDFGASFIIGEDFGETVSAPPSDIPFDYLTPALMNDALQADVSTDDWPFFYMPKRRYPFSYLIMILILSLVSLVFVVQLSPKESHSKKLMFSAPCFFLGAGFMLVETKGITELSLVYGSTWIVIGAVITAILIMASLANLVVMRAPPLPRILIYGLLVVALVLGLALVREDLSDLPTIAARILLTAALTVPLFFSGLAFSAELKGKVSVETALSSNLLGAMLGGFLEYNSMYFGFQSLYFLAIAMYLLAFFTSRGAAPRPAAA